MDLLKYLDSKNENATQFAKRANIPQPTLWRIVKGKVRPNPVNALKIEQATNGEVTRLELLYPKQEA